MRNFASLDRTASWVEPLIHESAAGRPLESTRHRFFILPRLVAACAMLIAGPVWLFFNGAPNASEAVIFCLGLSPLLSVGILARTGRLRYARLVSLLGWLAMAAAVEGLTDGHETAAIALLAIALVEAALKPEIATIVAVEAATVGLILVTAAAGGATLFPGALTTLVATAPLLLYVAFIVTCAIRSENSRICAEAANARDLNLLTGVIGDMVLHLDRSGAVSSIIGDTHRVYGLGRSDLIGRGFFQRVHIADRPAFLKLVSDAFERNTPLTALLRVQVSLSPSANGRYVEPVFNWFDARMCVSKPDGDEQANGAANHPRQVVCILRDVTSERRAGEVIAAARAESERASASKTRFLANVSHELRTPLNAIIGFAELLANPELAPKDAGKQREYAELIGSSGHHLLEVVNTILDMSKIEAGAMQICPEPFSLPALIDQCCDMVQLKAEEGGVRLERDYGDMIDDLVADKRACKQVVLNLLSNALKFTPAGGKVRVRVMPEGNLLALTVTDTGIGIAANDLSRLGDPFFQASAAHDRAYEGTGLGLSVVRGLVGLHGGAITVESAPKKGTSVTVRLPLDCRAPAPQRETSAIIETIPRHGPALGADVGTEKTTVKKIA